MNCYECRAWRCTSRFGESWQQIFILVRRTKLNGSPHTHLVPPFRSARTFGIISRDPRAEWCVASSAAEPTCVSSLSPSRWGNGTVEFRGLANDSVGQTNGDSRVGTSTRVACAWTGTVDVMWRFVGLSNKEAEMVKQQSYAPVKSNYRKDSPELLWTGNCLGSTTVRCSQPAQTVSVVRTFQCRPKCCRDFEFFNFCQRSFWGHSFTYVT